MPIKPHPLRPVPPAPGRFPRLWATLLLALGLLLPAGGPALRIARAASGDETAVVVAGQSFERRVTVDGHELQLNGTGTRGWYQAYAAGLYLLTPSADAAQVMAQAGPKRLELRMRFDLPAGAFADAFRSGVVRNLDADEAQRLEPRVADFEARVKALGQVRNRDVIDLDLEPGRGLVFRLNGKPQGAAIEGGDFYNALLAAFIGDKPYDGKLKAGLLGAGPPSR